MNCDRPKKRGRASITCRQVAEFLLDYSTGDLPARERAEFDRHMAACPPCIAYLDSYTKTVTLGKAALCGEGSELPPPMPEALVRAILAARAKAPPPSGTKKSVKKMSGKVKKGPAARKPRRARRRAPRRSR